MDRASSVLDENHLDASFEKPAFLRGPIRGARYRDGGRDDLLTGGCGAEGLQQGREPACNDPSDPAQLRRLAIFTNYRAIVDTSPGGGFGVLFGPSAPGASGRADLDGKVYGWEFIAQAGDDRPRDEWGPAGNREPRITLMLQVPDGFDPRRPRLLLAPSPGSRGIYGAISVGEWGLKNGFAVAYCDKGTGCGLHDLMDDRVTLADGPLVETAQAGDEATFVALAGNDLGPYRGGQLRRVAYKHAHSQTNPEQGWARHVNLSIDFALYLLNAAFELPKRHDRSAYSPLNTTIIAAGISNGGGACLRAAEQFGPGRIHGVVVCEPNVNPRPDRSFVIRQGDQAALAEHSRNLLDYTTLLNVYQPCASLAFAHGRATGSEARCGSLISAGLLRGATLSEQALEAQAEINRYGILTEQNYVQAACQAFSVSLAVAATFTQAYGRLRVDDPTCGYSFAMLTDDQGTGGGGLAKAFAVSSGIPPELALGIKIFNDRARGGPQEDVTSASPGTGVADQNLEGALRLRSLFLGKDAQSHEPLSGRELEVHRTIRKSIEEVQASGNLHGIPTIIVHGRSDSVIAPNHASRPYYALALKEGGSAAVIRYYEVENAHHFDVFNGYTEPPVLAGFAERYVPLYWYFTQALDLMLEHLTVRTQPPAPLPPSQLVRPRPRRKGEAITAANAQQIVPRISSNPLQGDQITFAHGVLFLPESRASA